MTGAPRSNGPAAGAPPVDSDQKAALPLRPEAERAWQLDRGRFPFVEEVQAEVARAAFFKLTPRWARLTGNGLGFGHKQAISFT